MEETKSCAKKVMEGIDMAIIHNQHGSLWPGVHKLAIYFPEEWEYDIHYNKKENDFATVTLWDDFLADFYLEKHGSSISRAMAASQKFGFSEHIDLYDFCVKLTESEENNYSYLEILFLNTQHSSPSKYSLHV
jgi:hypothetical protein